MPYFAFPPTPRHASRTALARDQVPSYGQGPQNGASSFRDGRRDTSGMLTNGRGRKSKNRRRKRSY